MRIRCFSVRSRILQLAAIIFLLCAPQILHAQAYTADDPASWVPRVRTEYAVSLAHAKSQLVQITMTLHDLSGLPIDLRLPTWRPGRYEILDPAGTIITLHAQDERGNPIAATKTDKSTWRVEPAGATTLTISYMIYANSLNNRTRHADDTHAFLSGSSVFLYTNARRSEPCRVRIDAPEGWHTATGLAPDPTIPNAWLAPSYDVLVDSPLEIGEHQIIEFAVDDTPHEIVFWGPVTPDTERLAHDFAAVVRTERDIFDGSDQPLPYGRFVFLIHAQPGIGGGTEHLNSTIMQTRPESFSEDGAYNGFLGLLAHEMFHTWNVKRLRPAGLVPYDYQHEDYTDLLWEAEGTTSYYTGIVLVRAGLKSADDYLTSLASLISRERRRPGYRVQSLADSSFDAWIKFNHRTPNDINSTVSFYAKGALVSLMLDMELRARTDNAISLDSVLQNLYQHHPLDAGGFTTQDMLDTLKVLSRSSFVDFFDNFVSGTTPLDLENALQTVGLDLEPEPADEGSYLGISASDNIVRSVRTDGPAFNAGIEVDDILIALDDTKIEATPLSEILDTITPCTDITLSVTRRGQPREIHLTTIANPISHWTLTRLSDPTPAQQAAYASWLGQPWPTTVYPEIPDLSQPTPSDP